MRNTRIDFILEKDWIRITKQPPSLVDALRIRTTFAFLKVLKFDSATRPALDYQQESQYFRALHYARSVELRLRLFS